MTYTNEIEVEVDFSDVENHLIEPTKSNDLEVSIDKDNMKKDSNISNVMDLTSDQTIKIDNSKQKRRPSLAGRASRFFKKKK
jgi:hypothetical protein